MEKLAEDKDGRDDVSKLKADIFQKDLELVAQGVCT
jgi:hypothetical protein